MTWTSSSIRAALGLPPRAGWPDQIASDHRLATLAEASLVHSGRPTVVTVGVGATAVIAVKPALAQGVHEAAVAARP